MDATLEILRERLQALAGAQLPDGDIVKLLTEIVACGGGINVELEDGRWKLIRRDGHFVLKKDDARPRPSTMPPRMPSRR